MGVTNLELEPNTPPYSILSRSPNMEVFLVLDSTPEDLVKI